MIHTGKYQKLIIKREKPQGLYLADEEGNEVLMPRKYMTEDMELDGEVEVFVYRDATDKHVATTEKPLIKLEGFACLTVSDVNKTGAFCEWGISKQLFIPYRNQGAQLKKGQRVVVHMYLDEVTDRLVGTTKVGRYLKQEADEDLQMGQKVDLMVYQRTELGYKVIINKTYAGLLYENEVPDSLYPCQELKGYIKPIRDDWKIDVSLQPVGHLNIEPNANKLLIRLEKNNGFLPFTDKSDPDLIRKEFGISKKLFKKALGALYKQRLVGLKEDGIYLLQK